MNILISVNEKYLEKVETMLFSLKRNTKELIVVYLLNRSLRQEQIAQFERYLERKCIGTLSVINVESAIFDSFPLIDHLAIETYYRILAQFFLPETLDRILWLDADIIIQKDIGKFYHQSFDGMKYVVCPDKMNPDIDHVSWTAKLLKARLGIPDKYIYFNAGVMLINLSKLRQETRLDMLLQNCLELKDKIHLLDQDILNALYIGQVKYAEIKYNYSLEGISRITKDDEERLAILHYTGPRKPWDYRCMNHVSKYYWKARYEQGHRMETIKSYSLAVMYRIYTMLRDLKNLFF